jgi:hypothetical protein
MPVLRSCRTTFVQRLCSHFPKRATLTLLKIFLYVRVCVCVNGIWAFVLFLEHAREIFF